MSKIFYYLYRKLIHHKMRHIIFLAIAFLAFTANAQLLWKVSGNGLNKPSYLMGTHHVAPASMCDSIKGFYDAIKNCDEVYGEIDKDLMNKAMSNPTTIMKYAIAPKDSTILTLLSETQLNKLDSILTKLTSMEGLYKQLAMQKPAMITAMIELFRTSKALPSPNDQIDIAIQKKAKELGKSTNGFETVEFQMNLLFGGPISKQAEDLIESIEKDSELNDLTLKLFEAYKKQDLNAIQEFLNDPKVKMSEEDSNKLIYDRNYNWVKKLKELMPQKSIFVCVGTGHLPSEKGLIQLLRNEGYDVNAVK